MTHLQAKTAKIIKISIQLLISIVLCDGKLKTLTKEFPKCTFIGDS